MVGAARRLATELVVIIARATQEIHWVAAGARAGGGLGRPSCDRYVGAGHGGSPPRAAAPTASLGSG